MVEGICTTKPAQNVRKGALPRSTTTGMAANTWQSNEQSKPSLKSKTMGKGIGSAKPAQTISEAIYKGALSRPSAIYKGALSRPTASISQGALSRPTTSWMATNPSTQAATEGAKQSHAN